MGIEVQPRLDHADPTFQTLKRKHMSDLPDDIVQKFVGEAAVIGVLLQRLGYFGACSLETF